MIDFDPLCVKKLSFGRITLVKIYRKLVKLSLVFVIVSLFFT